jgi:two-component sensor histidine kinase
MYERLYRSGSGDLIDLKIYIRDFVEFLFGIYVIDREKIRFVTTLEDIRLDLKRAVPVGLLLNELISNSLKYAFPENRTGEVRVDLKNLEGTVVLSVSDDGVGLPENFNPGETDSMGLTLVNMLAKQIGGAVEIKKAEERGTTAVLRFNL